MRPQGLREIFPSTPCAHRDCTLGGIIGTHPAVAFRNDNGRTFVFHIGCAPPRLRKMYYEQQREEADHGR